MLCTYRASLCKKRLLSLIALKILKRQKHAKSGVLSSIPVLKNATSRCNKCHPTKNRPMYELLSLDEVTFKHMFIFEQFCEIKLETRSAACDTGSALPNV